MRAGGPIKKTVRSQLKMLVALATPPDLLLAIEVRTCITIIKLNRTYFLRVTPLFPDLSLSNGCIHLSFPAEAESWKCEMAGGGFQIQSTIHSFASRPYVCGFGTAASSYSVVSRGCLKGRSIDYFNFLLLLSVCLQTKPNLSFFLSPFLFLLVSRIARCCSLKSTYTRSSL